MLSIRACFEKSLPCLHRREDTAVADFSVDERKLDAWCAWYAFTCEKLELKMLDEQRLRMGMSPPGMPSPFGMASRLARLAPPMDGLPRPETGMGFGNFSSRSGGPMGGEQPLPRHPATTTLLIETHRRTRP